MAQSPRNGAPVSGAKAENHLAGDAKASNFAPSRRVACIDRSAAEQKTILARPFHLAQTNL